MWQWFTILCSIVFQSMGHRPLVPMSAGRLDKNADFWPPDRPVQSDSLKFKSNGLWSYLPWEYTFSWKHNALIHQSTLSWGKVGAHEHIWWFRNHALQVFLTPSICRAISVPGYLLPLELPKCWSHHCEGGHSVDIRWDTVIQKGQFDSLLSTVITRPPVKAVGEGGVLVLVSGDWAAPG